MAGFSQCKRNTRAATGPRPKHPRTVRQTVQQVSFLFSSSPGSLTSLKHSLPSLSVLFVLGFNILGSSFFSELLPQTSPYPHFCLSHPSLLQPFITFLPLHNQFANELIATETSLRAQDHQSMANTITANIQR